MWRNRVLSLCVVLGFTGIFMGLCPTPLRRAEVSYFFLMTLGYAHFLGGAVASRERMRVFVPRGMPAGLLLGFLIVLVVTGFVGYVAFVQSLGSALYLPLFIPLLSLSLWHTVENDLSMQLAYRASSLRIGPIPRDLGHHLLSLCLSLLLLAFGIGS